VCKCVRVCVGVWVGNEVALSPARNEPPPIYQLPCTRRSITTFRWYAPHIPHWPNRAAQGSQKDRTNFEKS